MNVTRHFYLSAALGLCLAPVLTARAQPPEAATKTPAEAQKAREPETLPLVTWDELKKQLGGPTLVTLHVKEMPIGEVIDALNKQAPIPVTMQNRSYLEQQKKPPLTLDYEAQPFWEVVRDIAQKAGIGVQSYGGQRGVTFTPWGDENAGIASASGPAIFNLTSASYNRYVGQGKANGGNNESLSLSCTLFADPKLQWQQQGLTVHLTEALDNNNQSLLPAQDADIYNQGVPLEMNMSLKAVDAKGGSLRSLRGTFHGAVAAVSENWEVADVLGAKNVEKTIAQGKASTRLELQDVKPKGDGYQVTLVISSSGAANRQQAKLSTGKQIWLGDNFSNKMRLVDSEGRDLQLREQNSDSGGDQETRIITYTATFYPNRNGGDEDKSDVPAKFIMRYDSDWRELIIPFAFKDVELP